LRCIARPGGFAGAALFVRSGLRSARIAILRPNLKYALYGQTFCIAHETSFHPEASAPDKADLTDNYWAAISDRVKPQERLTKMRRRRLPPGNDPKGSPRRAPRGGDFARKGAPE